MASQNVWTISSPKLVGGRGVRITLELPGAAFARAVPRGLRIEEALCQPGRAQAELLSPSPANAAALKALLGKFALAKLELNGRTRTFGGRITGVRAHGILFFAPEGSDRKDAYRYSIVIEPSAALLKNNRRTRSFTGLSVPDVVRRVLKDAGMPPEEDASILNDADFASALAVEQCGESDWRFIERLLAFSGLNLRFVHDSASPADPKVYLSKGWQFGEDAKKIETYSARGTGALLSWSMSTDCAATDVEIGGMSMALNGARGTEPADMPDLTVHLDAAPFRVPRSQSVSGDAAHDLFVNSERTERQRAQAALAAGVRLSAERWRGAVRTLDFTPGSKFEVSDFFGEGVRNSFVVVKSKLECRTVWPTTFAAPPHASGSLMLEDFECRIEAADVSGSCGSFAFDPSLFEQSAAAGAPPVALYRGTICAAGGETPMPAAVSSLDQSNAPVILWTALEGASTPVPAELAVAGGEGRVRRPRPGESVLVAASGGRYWIIGSLAAAIEPANVLGRIRSDAFDACRFGHGSQATGRAEVVIRERARSLNDRAIDLLLSGDADRFIRSRASVANSRTLLEAWISKSAGFQSAAQGFLDAEGAYARALELASKGAMPSATLAKLCSDYQVQAKALSDKADEMVRTFGGLLGDESGLPLAEKNNAPAEENAGASGEAAQEDDERKESEAEAEQGGAESSDSSAKQDISINANRIQLQADQEVLSLGTLDANCTAATIVADNITITATKALSLSVGGNKITIDMNGVNIVSNKWMHGASGAFDAAIRLDSASGISMSGMTIAAKAGLQCAMADALGGSIATKFGNATIAANSFSVSTNPLYSMIGNLTEFVALTTLEAGAATSSSKDAANLSATIYCGQMLSGLGRDLERFVSSFSKNVLSANGGWVEFIVDTLSLVHGMIDEALTAMFMVDSLRTVQGKDSILSRYAAGSKTLTVRDAFRLAALAAKISTMLVAVIPLMAKISSLTATAKLSLTPGSGFEIQGKAFALAVQQSINQYISPTAAIPLPAQIGRIYDWIGTLSQSLVTILARQANLTGEVIRAPRREVTVLNSSETAAVNSEQSIEDSQVGANREDLAATTTGAAAAASEERPVNQQAAAVKNETGALDTDQTGMRLG